MCKASRSEAEGNLEFDGFDPSTSDNMMEDDQSAMGPVSSHDASQEETHSYENDDFKDKQEQMYQPEPLAFKSGLKYRSSHPLENIISLLNSEI